MERINSFIIELVSDESATPPQIERLGPPTQAESELNDDIAIAEPAETLLQPTPAPPERSERPARKRAVVENGIRIPRDEELETATAYINGKSCAELAKLREVSNIAIINWIKNVKSYLEASGKNPEMLEAINTMLATKRQRAGLSRRTGATPSQKTSPKKRKSREARTIEEVELAKRIEAGLFATELLAGNEAALSYTVEQMYGEDTPDNRAAYLTTHAKELETIVDQGKQANEEMIMSNEGLVAALAKRYVGQGLELPDLIQEGRLGLMHAIKKFDYTGGNAFSTYAQYWIRQRITRALIDQGRAIRLPMDVYEDLQAVRRVERHLHSSLQRAPSQDEIAHEIGLPVPKLTRLLQYRRSVVSLDQPLGSDSSQTLADICTEQTDAKLWSYIGMSETLAILNDEERRVVVMRVIGNMAFMQMATVLGRNAKSTAILYKASIEKLRRELSSSDQ